MVDRLSDHSIKQAPNLSLRSFVAMGPQRTQKQAPIANQNDAFGSGSRTRSKSATGQKKVPVGPPMTGSKSASHPQQPTASNKSTKARAPGPSQPTTISRHNFKVTLSYRTVTEEDEVGDRGPRSRKGLMSQTADTSSSIYRARYESRIADEMDEEETDEDEGDEEGGDGDEGDEEEGNEDEGDEEELGEVEMEEDEGEEQDDTQEQDVDEQVASGTEEQLPVPATAQKASHDLKHTPRRTNETSLNARAAKNKEIEKSLLIASEGKLHQDMLDIQPSDEMTQADRVRWDKISKELVTEMNTPSSYLGRLVRKMNGTHSSGRRGEDELAKEFAKFCNHVAERLACAVSGQSMKRVSGIFRFSGNHLMKDGEVPHPGSGEAASDNKLDIIVNGESTEDDTDRWWNHILTFGEVKLAPSWDLKDLLLGQILRYLVSALVYFVQSALHMLAENPSHSGSEKSCKTIQSPARTSVSRCAAICYAFSSPTLLVSALRLRTASKNRRTMRRSSARSLCCPVLLASCRNSGNRLMTRSFRYRKPTASVFNIN